MSSADCKLPGVVSPPSWVSGAVAAVELAAQDVKLKAPMRSMPDVLSRLKALMGAPESPASLVPATDSGPVRPPSTQPPAKMIGDWREIRPLARGRQGDVLLVERMPPKEHAIGVLKRVPPNLANDQKRLGSEPSTFQTRRYAKPACCRDSRTISERALRRSRPRLRKQQ